MVHEDIEKSWPDIDEQVKQYCHSYSKEPEFRLTVIDEQGRIIGDSEYPSDKMESHITDDRPEVLTAISGKRGEDTRKSKTKNITYRYLAEPIIKDGKTVGVIRVAFPVGGFLENRQLFFQAVLLCFLLMLLAATGLSIFLSWLWYKPLRLINEEAKRIAMGNLEPTRLIEGPLEMHQLSLSLESMRRTVSGQIETITNQREGLQTILQNLPDAIFAMNRDSHVVFYNTAAKKLFHLEADALPDASSVYLQDVVRNAPIIEWYLIQRRAAKNSISCEKVKRKEIDLFARKHFLELEFVEMENASGQDAASLLIISDLSESTRAARMKTDFVANASHELRTPLAAIRAALENLSDEVLDDRETRGKIIGIIDRHVSRLDALIGDLLALHCLEAETTPVRLEETDVSEQRHWIEELFRKRIEEKRLRFSVESDFGDEKFRIDNTRLGLILQNLLDNAIKFTPENGTISLLFKRDDSQLLVICRDTGCGIDPAEQDRVFERFYQANTSRTGDGRIRGTGLGLAIVKHALERMQGSVSLESRSGQGTVFTVRINLTQS